MDLDVSKHINIFSRDVVKILTDLKQMVNLVGGENLHVRKKEMQSIRSALSKAKLLDENTRIMFCGKKLLVYSN